MQFQQLTVFVEVAKTNSFSKAAQELYLSQSTVSTHISNLETFFKQPLFDRLGRQVVLTPFGKKMYYWATEILDLKDKALDDLHNDESLSGRIQIAASSVPASFIVPKLLKDFVEQYPKCTFSVSQGSSKDVIQMLLDGACDIAFVGDKHFEDEINYTPLVEDSFVFITPKDILLGPEVSVDSMKDYKFIFRSSGSGTQSNVNSIFSNNGIDINDLKVVGYFDNLQSIVQSVKDGMGCSIISNLAMESLSGADLNSYKIKEFKNYSRWFYLAEHKKRTPSKLSVLFRKNL